jgi:hypothetical protein
LSKNVEPLGFYGSFKNPVFGQLSSLIAFDRNKLEALDFNDR